MEILNNKINSSLGYKILITILFMVIFWLPRSGGLDVFMATDEGAWLYRAGDFYYALGQREFEHTYTTNHPGVVTSWLGMVAHFVEFPEYRGMGQGYFDEYYAYEEFMQANGIDMLDLLETARLVTVVFLTLLLGICFYIALDLFGFAFSSIAFVLVGFDPLFLATSRTYHLDAPMAVLVLLSLLILLLYYKNGAQSAWLLVFSGAMGGVAVLAKLTSAIYALAAVGFMTAYPFLFILGVEKKFSQKVKEVILRIGIWGGASAVALFLFWPAMWVRPVDTFMNLVFYALGTSSGAEGASSAYVEPTTFFFYNPLQPSFMNYPASFMWRTTPVVLLGLVLAVAAYALKAAPWQSKKFRGSIFGLLLFSVFYTLVMSISVKQSQKYYLPVVLMLDLVAGFGLASLPALVEKFRKDTSGYLQWAAGGAMAVLLAVQLILVLPAHPYYFTYYNPLLGGPQAASKEIFVGTGEGLNLAGEYLNTKPNAGDLNVLAWYGTGCLSYFFDGQVEIMDLDNFWSEDEQLLLRDSDYLVTYSNQWFRNRPEELLSRLESIPPEHTIWLQGIEYARIYNTAQLPDILFGK